MKRPSQLRRFARWVVRLLLRVGLLPASTKAETDTMGDWKRLQAEKDDPLPGLVLPDPNAPHAELIRRVRLYAQNGAKALAPLLDKPLPSEGPEAQSAAGEAWDASDGDREACAILTDCLQPNTSRWDSEVLTTIHAAYNSPWTVVNGEVYEVVTKKRPEVVQ